MAWIAVIILVVDRAVKLIALKTTIFEGTINSSLVFYFSTDPLISQLVSVGALGGIVGMAALYGKQLNDALMRTTYIPLILVFGGGASNVIDRFIYGGVIDMFIIPGVTVFNVADMAVLGGAAWLIYAIWHQKYIQERS